MCENKKRKIHEYQTGYKVLLRNAWKTKFNQSAYLGPYVITAVRDNDTVRAVRVESRTPLIYVTSLHIKSKNTVHYEAA